MTDKTPIREAAEAVTEALSPKADGGPMWGERIQTGIADAVEAIILGVLRERVPDDWSHAKELCERVGLCAYGEDSGMYTIPATAFQSRIVRFMNQYRKEIGL